MKTKDILNLDCRLDKNKEIIQKVLRQIKPLSKYSDEYDIPFEAVKKAVIVMCKKYKMHIRFAPDFFASKDDAIWCASIIDMKTYQNIENAYGVTLYETFAKTAIALYAEVKRRNSK